MCSLQKDRNYKVRIRKKESEEITRMPFSKKKLTQAELARYRETRPRRTPFLHVLLQRVFYPRLRHSAHDLVNRLPVLEDEQGRNSHNVEPPRRPRVLVRVQLPKSHLPLVLLSKRINNWANQATWSTPGCPAVDEDQGVLGDEGVEAGIVHLYRSVRRIGHVEFNSRLVRSDICLTPLGFR